MDISMDISDVAQMAPAMPARERILTTAYRLFTRRGIRAVGTDEVITQSGVAKATLYRHFPSKNDLVLAVLKRREELWTLEMVEQQSRLRGDTPEEQLLAIFGRGIGRELPRHCIRSSSICEDVGERPQDGRRQVRRGEQQGDVRHVERCVERRRVNAHQDQ